MRGESFGALRSCVIGSVRILFDECVPWPLSREIKFCKLCSNPHKQGWCGVTNGDLLAKAEKEFDVFVTSDQSLRYQQNLTGRRLAIWELWSNDWRIIQPHVENILTVIENMKSGDFIIFSPKD